MQLRDRKEAAGIDGREAAAIFTEKKSEVKDGAFVSLF